jgi:hypothetical protein
LSSIKDRFMAAYAAYKAFWNPGLQSSGYESQRLQRYDFAWRFYTNEIYSQLSSYLAATYPAGSQLYKYTKGLRNPVPSWVDFYVTNVWGGTLDLDAGNGKEKPSALPIITDNDALRPAIAKLWQWSNWNAKRLLATTYSAALGDAFIVVVDSPTARKAYMQVRRPSEFTDIEWDDFGHVKRAVIEYRTEDDQDHPFTFKQVIEHPIVWGGKFTRYTTFKDNHLFAYPENQMNGQATAQWEVPYDFVPVVHVPFRDTGEGWGALGYSATIPKIDAANSLASLLGAQIGKTVNPAYVAYGVQPGNITVGSGNNDDQGEIPILYIPKPPSEASLQPLITEIDLSGALALLDAQLADIARDLPELRMSEAMRSGLSGEALGRAFSDVAARIGAARGNHDSGLVRAHQMAIAIAGASGYDPAFRGFDLNSFKSGLLDHGIGDRPILPTSTTEAVDTQGKQWVQVGQAVTAGMPLNTALREIMGWEDTDIKAMDADQQAGFITDNEQ